MNMEKKVLHNVIKNTQTNIAQIVVLKDGEEVYSDQWLGYKKTDCTHIMSATKSIMSLLIGIAVDMKLISSIDDKVLDYFPDYNVKRGEKTIYDVTIRHLLTMRAPYKCKGDPWSKVCSSENWTQSSLDYLGGRSGLTDEFRYQTVCLHILSGILYKVSNMTTVDFANKYLFEPLGIAKHEVFYAKDAAEHKAFILNKEPKENVWFSDPTNLGTPGYGLCMSAEDLARIGLMCINKGKVNGKQIVSEKWLEDMTRPRPASGKYFDGLNYGYLWWIVHPEKNIYAAIGNSGNVLYINPEKNLVVAVTAVFKAGLIERVEFIEDYLLDKVI